MFVEWVTTSLHHHTTRCEGKPTKQPAQPANQPQKHHLQVLPHGLEFNVYYTSHLKTSRGNARLEIHDDGNGAEVGRGDCIVNAISIVSPRPTFWHDSGAVKIVCAPLFLVFFLLGGRTCASSHICARRVVVALSSSSSSSASKHMHFWSSGV